MNSYQDGIMLFTALVGVPSLLYTLIVGATALIQKVRGSILQDAQDATDEEAGWEAQFEKRRASELDGPVPELPEGTPEVQLWHFDIVRNNYLRQRAECDLAWANMLTAHVVNVMNDAGAKLPDLGFENARTQHFCAKTVADEAFMLLQLSADALVMDALAQIAEKEKQGKPGVQPSDGTGAKIDPPNFSTKSEEVDPEESPDAETVNDLKGRVLN